MRRHLPTRYLIIDLACATIRIERRCVLLSVTETTATRVYMWRRKNFGCAPFSKHVFTGTLVIGLVCAVHYYELHDLV